ncbi:MAG: hypothetical protein AAF449_01070, partial [Myxococcota bacterium]
MNNPSRPQVEQGRRLWQRSTDDRKGFIAFGDRRRRIREAERENVHRAYIDANATLDAGRVFVVERLLVLGESHHVNPYLTVFRTLGAANALVVG